MTGILNLLMGTVRSAVATDPYFEYTTLLLPGNGPNLKNNNEFLDSSANAFTVTRNPLTGPNAPTQGTFSPFSQTGWGNRFNFATPDALRPSATTISNFGTGAFTVEFWINFQNTNNAGIYYGGNGGGSVFLDYYSGSLRWGISGGAIPISYAFTPTIGRWYHVAFTRSSTTDTLYIDGTSVATGSDSQNYPSDSSPYVGSWNGSTYNGTAFISNFRIVKGVTVYTGAFTPPTSPLTATQSAGTNIAAITTGQTSLLTCQSNRFVDNGQGNTGNTGFTITVNGSPSVQAFSPFNPTSSWSATTNGGSGYFDGSGDYLTAPTNAAFNLGTTDFTIEWSFYYSETPPAGSGYDYLFGMGANATTGIALYIQGGVPKVWNGSLVLTSSQSVVGFTWYHLALVRSSGTLTMYLNGTSVGSVSLTSNLTGGELSSGPSVGTWSPVDLSYFPGYISNFRIVKGTAIVPPAGGPTSPLTAVSGTSLLLNFTNAGIYDATSKNDLETVGNAQISNTTAKFGTTSIYMGGSGNYLIASRTASPLFRLGTGDFTIEGWFYLAVDASTDVMFDFRGGVATAPAIFLYTSNQLAWFYNGSILYQPSSLTFTSGQWNHVALVRASNVVKFYLNGTGASTTYTDTNNYPVAPCIIGTDALAGGSNYWNGYIQDTRITLGVARYTTNFTPGPAAAFPTL